MCKFLAVCFSFALLCAVPLRLAAEEVFTSSDLIEGNTNALGLIHDLEITLETSTQNFMNGKPYGAASTSTWRWARSGRKERVRTENDLPPREDGLSNNLVDQFNDGTHTKMLSNWDSRKADKLTLDASKVVRAQIIPAPGLFGGADPLRFLMWTPLADPADLRRGSLAEMAAEAVKVELVGKEKVGDYDTWRLRIEHPGLPPGKDDRKTIHDVYVAPRLNFMIVRHMQQIKGGWEVVMDPAKNLREKVAAKLEFEALRFKEFPGGIFIPEETVTTFSVDTSDRRWGTNRTLIKEVTVNRPLSADALDFRFPENAIVIHAPPVKGRQRVQVWGKDNQPKLENPGPRELRLLQLEWEAEEQGDRRRRRIVMSGVTAAVVGLGLVVIFILRKRRGAQ